jgi:DNA-binding response OmpR family regulator
VSEPSCKVLILDCDPDVLTLLQHVLESAGIDTTITWNYIEARELAHNNSFDVILVGGYAPEFTAETFWRDFKSNAASCSYLLLGASEGEAEHYRRLDAGEALPKRDPLRVLEEVQKCWRSKTVNARRLHQTAS